jgi:predicted NBD/HSP70 family sugar kinase/biotin operon repressor
VRKINPFNFTRATRSTPRDVNRQIALSLVREHQPISRAELSRRMSISRGMVTALVNQLITEGAVFEGETGQSRRGRKPTLLYVRTHDRLAIGVDIRFSRTYVTLADFSGTQRSIETLETVFDPEALIQELAKRFARMIDAEKAAERVEGIGLVVPGMVDRATGRILNSPQLGWRDVDIRQGLEAISGYPVFIENAPIACALAEMWLGQRGSAVTDFVYVTVSDGVGAGLVVNGQVVRGTAHTAGEFGHIPLDPDGPYCLCGARGCWEAYTSNLATVARYLGKPMTPDGARAMLKGIDISFIDVITLARTGDAQARHALQETGRYLGQGMSMIVNALNPSRIIVGGEITAAWDLVQEHIRAGISERSLTDRAAATPIIPEVASRHPRLRGATALVAGPVFAAPQLA